MEMNLSGWIVTAIAVLITGISKSGLGGALGGLAVPFMAIWLSPRDALAVMLPILITMDFVGIRAWSGKASWPDLRYLIPGAIVGILIGSLLFGVMSDRIVKIAVGLIAVGFALDKMMRRKPHDAPVTSGPHKTAGVLLGACSGFTSTLAHAGGPPVMMYLLGRRVPRQTLVATSVFFFAVINMAKLPFFISLGLFRRETLTMSAMLLPLVPLGVWLGLKVLAKIPEKPFYIMATAALGLSGVKLLWDGVFV